MLLRAWNNIGLKMLAVLIAGIVWGYVYLYSNYSIGETYEVAAQVRGLSQELALAGANPPIDHIRIRVQGPVRSFRRFDPSRMNAYFDCSAITQPGTARLRPRF